MQQSNDPQQPPHGTEEEDPVLDVHPPHEAAHSWRDILIHLATITVGLFIALSLEGCVEWQHHRHLVREARENIRTEIRDNQRDLRNALNEIHKEQAQVKANIQGLKTLRNKPGTQGLRMSLVFSGTSMANASWSTAHETGAFAYMTYPEVKDYAELYDLQSIYGKQTDRVQAAYTSALSVIYTVLDNDPSQHPTPQDYDSALQHMNAVQSELLFYDSIAKGLEDEYQHVLQRNF